MTLKNIPTIGFLSLKFTHNSGKKEM